MTFLARVKAINTYIIYVSRVVDPDSIGCLDPEPDPDSESGSGSRGKKKKKMKKKS
jgi:hypothetical protein